MHEYAKKNWPRNACAYFQVNHHIFPNFEMRGKARRERIFFRASSVQLLWAKIGQFFPPISHIFREELGAHHCWHAMPCKRHFDQPISCTHFLMIRAETRENSEVSPLIITLLPFGRRSEKKTESKGRRSSLFVNSSVENSLGSLFAQN